MAGLLVSLVLGCLRRAGAAGPGVRGRGGGEAILVGVEYPFSDSVQATLPSLSDDGWIEPSTLPNDEAHTS